MTEMDKIAFMAGYMTKKPIKGEEESVLQDSYNGEQRPMHTRPAPTGVGEEGKYVNEMKDDPGSIDSKGMEPSIPRTHKEASISGGGGSEIMKARDMADGTSHHPETGKTPTTPRKTAPTKQTPSYMTTDELSAMQDTIKNKYKGSQADYFKSLNDKDLQKTISSLQHYSNLSKQKAPMGYDAGYMKEMQRIGDSTLGWRTVTNPADSYKWARTPASQKKKWKEYYAGQLLSKQLGDSSHYLSYVNTLAKSNPAAARTMMQNAAQGNKMKVMWNAWNRGDMHKLMESHPAYKKYAPMAKFAHNYRWPIAILGGLAVGGMMFSGRGKQQPQQQAQQRPTGPRIPHPNRQGIYNYRGMR